MLFLDFSVVLPVRVLSLEVRSSVAFIFHLVPFPPFSFCFVSHKFCVGCPFLGLDRCSAIEFLFGPGVVSVL
jgi:hypothetical protein